MKSAPVLKLSPSKLSNLSFYITAIAILVLDILALIFFFEYKEITFISTGVVAIFVIYNLLYTTAYINSYRILLSEDTLEFSHGVFFRKVETIEMHRINDFTKERTLLDQILGLSTVVVHSSDVTTPLMRFKGLRIVEAQYMIKFLQKFSSDSIVKHYIKQTGGIADVSLNGRISKVNKPIIKEN